MKQNTKKREKITETQTQRKDQNTNPNRIATIQKREKNKIKSRESIMHN